MIYLLKKRTHLICAALILLAVSLFGSEEPEEPVEPVCSCKITTVSKTIITHCNNLDVIRCQTLTTICGITTEEMTNGPCSGDKTPTSKSDKKASAVDAFSRAYIDLLQDSASVDGVSGCGPCGSAGSSGGVNKLSLSRNYVSRRAYRVWDMGLGQSSNLDFRLSLSEEPDGSLTIYQDAPGASFAFMYMDGRNGDVRDGIFHGAQDNSSVEMHLLDANDNVVVNYADAVKIRFVDFKFITFEYEVIALSSNNEYAARLVSIKNLNDRGVDISYADAAFTVQDLINDPSLDPALQWRRSSATDSTGRTFNFNYHTTAIGGDYVISTVTLPNSSVITYDYTDTYLSKVTYPDGSFSTYSYSTDANGDTVYSAQETSGKVKEIYMSSSVATSYSNQTGAILYNQSSMATGTVVLNDEIAYAMYTTGGNGAYVYTGENQMKKRHLDREEKFFEEDFTYSQDSNGNITADLISGTFEKTYLSRNYTSTNGSEYPTNVKNENGNNFKYIYDNKNRIVVKSYNDNSFEAWSYNDLNQETRHRDRLGRINLKSYDSRGNLLTREVGLLDFFTGGLSTYSPIYWGTSNLAQIPGTTASQSSGSSGSKALDNSTDGNIYRWSVASTTNEANPWLKVHLVRSSLVNTVKVYNSLQNNDHLSNFDVTLYDGGVQVYQQNIPGVVDPEGMVEITLPAGTYADEVEIKINGTTKLLLAEVKVFGVDTVADALEPIVDLATADYGIYTNEYYPTGHQNEHLLRYKFDANLNRTEYIYDASHNLLQVNEPDDAGTGYHAKNIMTYDAYNRMITSTDAVGRTTAVEYDARERHVKTTYNDGSTELTIYGTGLQADLVVKTKDRNGNVTKREYDNAARVTKTIRAYSVMSADGSTETVNLASMQSFTEVEYLIGQKVPRTVNVDGDITEYIRDYRLRPIATIRHADSNSALTSTTEYQSNRLFKSTDPYGRGTFYAYRSSDSAMVRTFQETTPGAVTRTSNAGLLTLNPDNSLNAGYLRTLNEIDNEGQRTAVYDSKSIRHETDYDSRGRATFSIRDAGGLNQTSQTIYDANSNVIEVRNPRYFSESINDRTTIAYTNRNLTASRTVAAGSAIAATESFTYYDDGRSEDHTDFRGKTTTTVWHQCCGRLQASIDQTGNQQVSNNDFYSNVTHSAVVSAAETITDYHNLPDTETVQEVTTKYDSRHRPVARTVWLQPLGLVDPNDVPIATDPALGLTTNYLYYDETTGHPELAPLLTELAADGITFDAYNDGSATIAINAEGNVSVSIADGAGRTIASGAYDKDDFLNSTYTLVTWSSVVHDTVVNDLLETKSISALGFENKVQTDGAGRRIKSIDAENNIATFEYDNNSNLVSSRDANGVGQDCIFDKLNRDTSCTDTKGDTSSRTYDLSNNVVSQTDAKFKTTTCIFDERNRRESCTDRIAGTTDYAYDDNNNVLTITDALNKVTTYAYDDRNLLLSTTYADHLAGSNAGDADYGITECSYDALRRKEVSTDQLGDTVTYVYDLASRLTDREYRLADTTLESTDTFTYDNASRVLTASKGRYSNTVTYTYDEIGRKETETTTVAGNSYTTTCDYDADNRETSCAYPAGSTIYKTYTDRNQLATAAFNAQNVLTSTYDSGMREATRTLGNGLVATSTYFADNTRDTIAVAGKADLSFAYTYDANKNVTSETSTGSVMADYAFSANFDDADRVTQWDRSGTTSSYNSQTWNLDKIGNWDSVTTDGNTETRTHNDVHELTGISGSSAPEYDTKGNMTLAANGNTLVWDIDNHLVSVSNGLPIATYTYDALGRRLEKLLVTGDDTLFVSHGHRVIEEYESTGGSAYALARSYAHGTYVDDVVCKVEDNAGSPTELYYHTDRQFNIRGLTDANGDVVELYAYTVYGKQTVMDATGVVLAGTAEDNNYGFTGRYLDDETGLWYFRARYFSDELGRFISRDPLGYVDGMSLYAGYFAAGFALDPSGTYVHPDGIIEPQKAIDSIKKLLGDKPNEKYDALEKIEKFYTTDVVDGKKAPGNRYIFTCKYGWIDMGHFFTSAKYAATDLSAEAVYAGSLAVELAQANVEFYFGGNFMRDTAQSAYTFEDINSNYQGAYFGDSFKINRTNITEKFKEFLIDAGAVNNLDKTKVLCCGRFKSIRKLLEDDVKSVLNGDMTKYTGDRSKGLSRKSALNYQRTGLRGAYKCLCNGDKPAAGFITYK